MLQRLNRFLPCEVSLRLVDRQRMSSETGSFRYTSWLLVLFFGKREPTNGCSSLFVQHRSCLAKIVRIFMIAIDCHDKSAFSLQNIAFGSI